jgi:hypothetical protein
VTNTDQRLTTALLQAAPPARDPAFRLQVLERRERQRFRRHALSAVAAAAATVLISVMMLLAVGGGRVYTAGSVMLFAIVLVTAGAYLPVFGRLMRRVSL